MQNRAPLFLALALTVAALGCAKARKPDARSQADKAATEISLDAQIKDLSHRILGDVNGDGFDDFLLSTMRNLGGDAFVNESYLFYGNERFPAQLALQDADAVFTAGGPTADLGDINGDGLADFTLAGEDGFTLILGNTSRLSGAYGPRDAGVFVHGKPLEEPNSGPPLSEIKAAGDVDGDGIDDVLMSMWSASSLGGFGPKDYVVLGRKEALPTEWDASLAVAEFGLEAPGTGDNPGTDWPSRQLSASAAGDLDGDGHADLLASGHNVFVFYGSDRLETDLSESRADAALQRPANSEVYGIGDLDADEASDLAVISSGTLGIVYGAKTRLTGRVELDFDLSITTAHTPNVALMFARAGDIDGDGKPELVLTGDDLSETANGKVGWKTLYILRGTTRRRTGTLELSELEARRLGAAEFSSANVDEMFRGNGDWSLNVGGDVDGDGSVDILTSGSDVATGPESARAVMLIPSTRAQE